MTMDRRAFLKKTAGSALGFGLLLGFMGVVDEERPNYLLPAWDRQGLIRPPGSVEEAAFLARCIRCTRCAEVCQPGAIRLFGKGSGKHQGTPFILPEETACTLCLSCGAACPTGAIEPLSEMTQAQMGTAVVDERLCVSHNGSGICGACFTACPLKGRAIRQGQHNRPTVDPDQCVGCGLCEDACIVKENKAIRVVSRRRFA
ncbi:MAG: 4Fe-4S dicluster domain-containing protein [Deltaproteobacteria bacterium]|nr:MAG: 4Fe-4S dicluster domain-containing protein [Deltaproteobacteria bacterium]